jgi:hypothetical protein
MRNAPYLIAALVVALSTACTFAQECCCSCGCVTCVRKVCHVKCETKKVPKTTFTCECEDFCVPGPSKKCGYDCEVDCHGCEKCKPHWIPQCAKVHTRHKLKKVVTDKEEKTYKWVVETFCEKCACRCVTTEAGLRQLQAQDLAAETESAEEAAALQAAFAAEPFDRSVRPAAFQLPGLSTTDRFLAPARNLRESFRLPWQK